MIHKCMYMLGYVLKMSYYLTTSLRIECGDEAVVMLEYYF